MPHARHTPRIASFQQGLYSTAPRDLMLQENLRSGLEPVEWFLLMHNLALSHETHLSLAWLASLGTHTHYSQWKAMCY
eukprot:2468494-Amphidinium_carterae.2